MCIKFQWLALFVLLLAGCATETAQPVSQNNTPITKPSATPLPTNTAVPTATPTSTTSPTSTPRLTRTPSPTSTLTPTSTPTLTVAEIDSLYAEAIDSLETALHGQKLPIDYSHSEDFTDLLRQTVTDFLNLTPQSLNTLTLDILLVQLETLLPYKERSTFVGSQSPLGYFLDIDLDGQTDFILEPSQNYGGAIIVFLSSRDYTSIVLSDFPGDRNGFDLKDATGDGQPELWWNTSYIGASGMTRSLTIFRWQSKQQAFKSIFSFDAYFGGAATDGWEMQSGPNGSTEFVSWELLEGIFDAKYLDGLTVTKTWQWDEVSQDYVVVDEHTSAPEVHRHQFNIAEEHFTNYDYGQAVDAFQKVITDDSLQEGVSIFDIPDLTDWQSLAHLRLGQIYATLEREEEAKAEFVEVQNSPDEGLSQVATVFLDIYEGPTTLETAWATMLKQAEIMTPTGNIDFAQEVVLESVYTPAMSLVNYFNQQGITNQNLAEQFSKQFSTMLETDTEWFDWWQRVIDLNGDGQQEIIFILPDQTTDGEIYYGQGSFLLISPLQC